MRAMGLGHVMVALGILGLGILGLKYDDYAMGWQPVSSDVPYKVILAYLSGGLLLVTGLGVLIKRVAVPSAAVLAAFLLSWLILLQFPRLSPDFFNAGVWLGVGETLELVTGTWMLLAMLAHQHSKMRWAASALSVRMASMLFGLSLPLIGLSHFVYVHETAAMVPAWLPMREDFAYLTGAGHIAAGIAILTGVWPRLGVTLEAVMMSSFVLLVHIPGVIKEPTSRFQWTMLCVACTIAGSAWVMSKAYQSTRWRATGQYGAKGA